MGIIVKQVMKQVKARKRQPFFFKNTIILPRPLVASCFQFLVSACMLGLFQFLPKGLNCTTNEMHVSIICFGFFWRNNSPNFEIHSWDFNPKIPRVDFVLETINLSYYATLH